MRWFLLIIATLIAAYHFVDTRYERRAFAAHMYLSGRSETVSPSQIGSVQAQFDSHSQTLPSLLVPLGLSFGSCLPLVTRPRHRKSPPPVDSSTVGDWWRSLARFIGFGLWSTGVVLARHYANTADSRQSYLMARYEIGRKMLLTFPGGEDTQLQQDWDEIGRLGGMLKVLDPTVLALVVATVLFAWWWSRPRKDSEEVGGPSTTP